MVKQRAQTTNREAFDELVTDDLEERAPALIQLGRSLADAVDAEVDTPCGECKRSGVNAALAREYRQVLTELAGLLEVEDDGQAAFDASLRTAVGNKKAAGTGNARARSGGGQRGAGNAADAVAATGRGRRPRGDRG